MTAAAAINQKPDPAPRCPTCGGAAEFGYRNKQTGELDWYCVAHRLGQFWADARLSPPANKPNEQRGEADAKNFERSDLEAAERRAGVSDTVDVVAGIDAIPAWMVPRRLALLIERHYRRRPPRCGDR
jgi:hypothetical protein